MTKRLAYIVMLLIFVAGLSSAKTKNGHDDLVKGDAMRFDVIISLQKDTTKRHQPDDEPKKIKEISKAKRQAKPEKIIVGGDNVQDPKVKPKPKRERRPEGLDRPPEIPRRNGN